MQPPNIFPTHVALKAESVTARRHGAVIGELAALAFVALYLVGDGIWLLCARIRLRVRARNLAITAKGSAHVNNVLRKHGYKWRKADGWWHLFRADGTEVAPVGDQTSGLHINALAEIDGDEGKKWLDGCHAHSKARHEAFRMARAASANYVKAVQS